MENGMGESGLEVGSFVLLRRLEMALISKRSMVTTCYLLAYIQEEEQEKTLQNLLRLRLVEEEARSKGIRSPEDNCTSSPSSARCLFVL